MDVSDIQTREKKIEETEQGRWQQGQRQGQQQGQQQQQIGGDDNNSHDYEATITADVLQPLGSTTSTTTTNSAGDGERMQQQVVLTDEDDGDEGTYYETDDDEEDDEHQVRRAGKMRTRVSNDDDEEEGVGGARVGDILLQSVNGRGNRGDGANGQDENNKNRKRFTEEEERAVVKKFDRKLVVFMAGLYLLSFLDRSNIGNARIAGMDDDLQSVPPKDGWYEWALTAFYISYIAFEWMSLLWRMIPAHIYVASLVFSWGLAASLQAVAVNYPMLIFLRTVLGIGEAGFTGVPFYLSFFFKRDELAFRTAIFISAAPLATSFASSLAWLILKVSAASPIAPWRLLFLIEGFPSILVAGLAFHIIPDSPQTAPYLSKREKRVARLRLLAEKSAASPHQEDVSSGRPKRSSARDALAVFTDPIAWMSSLILFLTNMAYSSLPVFLPTILRSMGHDSLTSQALAAPPYLASFLFVLATAHVSDSMKARGPHLIFHALSSAAGYAVLALSNSSFLHLDPGSWVRYLAVYPAAIGFFNVVVLTITWNINNQRGEARQGTGFALMQVIGQLGPLIGTRLYPDVDGPYYTNGMRVCAGAMGAVAVIAGVMRWYMKRQNLRMDREEDEEDRQGEEGTALVGEKGQRLGEKFRYML